MLTANLVAAAFWLISGLAIVHTGRDLGLGELAEPGPGFMFFWVGLVIAGLALGVLFVTWRDRAAVAGQSFTGGQKWAGIILVTVLLLLYAWLLPVLGFALLTLLFLVLLFRLVDPLRWPSAILSAVLITAGNYLVFAYWLGTQLPAGTFIEWAVQWTS